MSFLSIIKDTYRGSKTLFSELGKGIELFGNELDAWNQKQEKLKPVRNAIHVMRINNYCINHLKMMIPEENKESIDLLNKFDALCKDWIQVLKVGADENHPSNQHVIELANKLVSEKDFQQFDVCELIFNTSEKELTNKGFKVSEAAENNNFLKAAEMVEYLYKIEGDQLNKTAENHFDDLEMFAKNLANLKTKLNIK